ncbi:MAG: RDD family protein [Pararhodobacter sp.]
MTLPDPAYQPEFYRALLVKRLLAWGIDLVVTLVIVAALVVVTVFIGLFFLPLLWIAVSIAYRWVMLSNYHATAGMMLAGITLRHLDERRPDPLVCLLHAVIFSFSMVFVLPQIASVALMMVTPYRQGLNDLVLGTTMINRYLED